MISPVLANLYLHYVLDLWVEAWRKKLARGEVIIVRYDGRTVEIPRKSNLTDPGPPSLAF